MSVSVPIGQRHPENGGDRGKPVDKNNDDRNLYSTAWFELDLGERIPPESRLALTRAQVSERSEAAEEIVARRRRRAETPNPQQRGMGLGEILHVAATPGLHALKRYAGPRVGLQAQQSNRGTALGEAVI